MKAMTETKQNAILAILAVANVLAASFAIYYWSAVISGLKWLQFI